MVVFVFGWLLLLLWLLCSLYIPWYLIELRFSVSFESIYSFLLTSKEKKNSTLYKLLEINNNIFRATQYLKKHTRFIKYTLIHLIIIHMNSIQRFVISQIAYISSRSRITILEFCHHQAGDVLFIFNVDYAFHHNDPICVILASFSHQLDFAGSCWNSRENTS